MSVPNPLPIRLFRLFIGSYANGVGFRINAFSDISFFPTWILQVFRVAFSTERFEFHSVYGILWARLRPMTLPQKGFFQGSVSRYAAHSSTFHQHH